MTGHPEGNRPAVVIGLGGSGVQVLSRVRAAMPDRGGVATQFLCIDTVPADWQNPPLPSGGAFAEGEYINLLRASSGPAERWGQHAAAQDWFDHTYPLPQGTLFDGVRGQRMLGRLAFSQEADRVAQAVSGIVDRAVGSLDDREMALSETGEPIVDVYVVTSSCGGTGSGGLFATLLAVWEATRARGIVPRIRLFTFLPGIFHSAVLEHPGGHHAAEFHRANAYAFFTELDHFLADSDDFAAAMGRDGFVGDRSVTFAGLVHQVFLIDGTLSAKGRAIVTESYEDTACVLTQFLTTEAEYLLAGGLAQYFDFGGTTVQALAQSDAWMKPRRYCAFGIGRVVFPGETIRRHMALRYADWLLSRLLLRHPDDHVEMTRKASRAPHVDAELDEIVGGFRGTAEACFH